MYYRDPADDEKQIKKMSMLQLVARAYPKSHTPWVLGSGRWDLTPVRT